MAESGRRVGTPRGVEQTRPSFPLDAFIARFAHLAHKLRLERDVHGLRLQNPVGGCAPHSTAKAEIYSTVCQKRDAVRS